MTWNGSVPSGFDPSRPGSKPDGAYSTSFRTNDILLMSE